MKIRTACAGDADVLAAIYAPFVAETAVSFETTPPTVAEFAERIERGLTSGPWIVAEVGDRVVGYAYASEFRSRPAYSRTRETTVYVARSAQRMGIGHAMMQELLDRLREASIHLAIAGITLPNESSVALHERLGFVPVGVFHGVGHKFGQPHDVGFWELDLSAPDSAT